MTEHLNLIATVAIALVTFIGTAGVTVGVSTWKVSQYLKQHEAAFVTAINDHQLSDITEFAAIRREIDTAGDSIRTEVGESLHAIRNALHTMELSLKDTAKENLETFLKRASFYEVNRELKDDIKELMTAMNVLQGAVNQANANDKRK